MGYRTGAYTKYKIECAVCPAWAITKPVGTGIDPERRERIGEGKGVWRNPERASRGGTSGSLRANEESEESHSRNSHSNESEPS